MKKEKETRLLTDAEEQDLSTRIQAGDRAALGRLVTANQGFVVTLARQYAGRGVAEDDLVAEGNIGLMRAAARYDGGRGKRFVTYAAPYVREAMEEAIEQQAGLYRVPRDASNPALEKHRSRALSIDAPIGGSAELSLGRVIPDGDAPNPEDQLQGGILRGQLERAVTRLPDRERRVMEQVYGIGMPALTMAEVGEVMGLKRERVRQIRDRALRRLRALTR